MVVFKYAAKPPPRIVVKPDQHSATVVVDQQPVMCWAASAGIHTSSPNTVTWSNCPDIYRLLQIPSQNIVVNARVAGPNKCHRTSICRMG